ncbi:Hypothetical protein MVR_LOCUS24 [uncultured virus]|nr:Hypothetical protein MVR_LOCUS24 [uncultured virus]
MPVINLHSIFRHLVDDEQFLSTIIETETIGTATKTKSKKGFNLMAGLAQEYAPLAPGETQNYASLPKYIKSFLTPDHVRVGVKNITEKNLSAVNISFLNSLNLLLRPDLARASVEEQLKNFGVLEKYVSHMITRNYRIDKVKNTRRVQTVNKELVRNMTEGRVTHDLIQFIINIFEINLIVFDLTAHETLLYWASGHMYPYLNLFRPIFCMAFVRGNYEPIMLPNSTLPEELRCRIYSNILLKLPSIKLQQPIKLAPYALSYINTWNISQPTHMFILSTFFMPLTTTDFTAELAKVEDLELNGAAAFKAAHKAAIKAASAKRRYFTRRP